MKAVETQRTQLASGGAQRASAAMKALGIAFAAILASGAGVAIMAQTGMGQPAGLIVLALLAVVGVFFSFGFLSGFVRFQERAQESEVARGVADAAESAFQILSADGSVVYANAAYRALFGTSTKSVEEALAGDPRAAEAVYRLSRAAERLEERTEDLPVREFRLRAIATAVAGVHQTPRPVRWLRVSVRPFVPSPTVPDGRRMTLWSAVDITQDRSRELDAISGLEQALSFYNTMPVGLFAVAPGGQIVHLNQTLGSWLGIRGDASRSTWSLGDICPPDVAALVASVRQGAGATVQRFDVDLLREDGRAMPVRFVCKPSERAGRGEPMTVLVFDRTIDELQHGSVRAVADRFSRVFHGAPFAIATLDAQGHVVSANAAFRRMTGDKAVEGAQIETLSKLLLKDVEPEQRAAVEAGLQRVIAGRATAAPFEVSFGSDQQTTRRIYLNPLTSSPDPREAAILYMLDTTEIRALELKFAQSQKMEAVGKLAGGIAHDFNNVLTVIIGLSDLLLQSRRPTDPGYGDIIQIRSNANRAAGMVGQLLAYSRKQTLKPEVLALNDVVQDFGFSLNRLLGEKVTVSHKSGRDLWLVKADKTQFEQILMNLAVNARDAMPKGGELTVRTKNVSVRDSLKLASQSVPSGEYVMVEVEDSGSGMKPEVVARIFEPFFTTKDVGKGTGLGLSTVYGIVKQTGGFIFCDSEIGKGTTFRIYLPRHIPAAEDLAAAQKDKKKETVRDLSGTGRVLLVEDEDGVRSMAVRALQRQGYTVVEATTGLEALEIAEQEGYNFDLVVSDVIMPEMDGPTMFTEMRKKKPELKIIFMSGYPADAFEKGLAEGEEFAFLQKPFTLPQLAAKVKEQLSR